MQQMTMRQATLFDNIPPSVSQLERELTAVRQELSNVRKGLFKRWADLENEVQLLRALVRDFNNNKENEDVRRLDTVIHADCN